MAKRPAAGRTKTRLTPHLDAEQAADLYCAFLADIVDGLARRDDVTTFVAVDAVESARWFREFAPELPQVLQVGADLGARLDVVLRGVLDAGHTHAFAIGSDSPDLPPEHLCAAFALLDDPDCDIVLGPSDDGGYYLIGWKQAWTPVVADVEMSTPTVLQDTLRVAERVGATVALAPSWYDIDEPADLDRLRASPYLDRCPRTAARLGVST